ncbi:MAG: Hsp70 family protein, partial [Lachnospiraceae bacterium]|nr:Hsp70 family protein [Lachnospiraceae bacterium]
MAVLGIDLGTTNSLAAYWADGAAHLVTDERGQSLFPSVVSYVGEEGLAVGPEAKERILTHRRDTACSFKRFMGTDKKYRLGNRDYTPMELSAMVLERIRRNAEYFLKEEIEEAIITVPAYFNDKQRSDTKKAAKIAGLHVERLINEPSAAALAYRTKYGEEDATLLVFDFGGGTLDLSYVECFDNIIEIVAVAGDNYLGGDDIDRLIAEYFCRENGLSADGPTGHIEVGSNSSPNVLTVAEYAALLQCAEAAKCRLEQEPEVELALEIGGKLRRARLDNNILFQICMPLFSKIKKLFIHILNDAEARVSDLDDLIMVGGSSRLTVVQRFLTELLGKEPIVLGETDKVVAMGAGVYAGIRTRREDIRDMLLTDVCPFTLGVETWHAKRDLQGYLLPMIERNSTLPASRCKRLVTMNDYQNAITVRIYQGEEYYAKDNLFLGEVSIPVYPKPAGEEWVDVYFTYDINGILYVEVANSQNMRSHILLSNQELGRAELEQYRKEMQKLMLPPIQQEENKKILAALAAYYENSTGGRREQIGSFINWFAGSLQSGRLHLITRAVEEAKRQLALLESFRDQEEELLFDGELKLRLEEEAEEFSEETGDFEPDVPAEQSDDSESEAFTEKMKDSEPRASAEKTDNFEPDA